MKNWTQPEWLDLKALQAYCGMSERTLRGWITRADNPLPAVQPAGRIMVKKSTFDDWMERQPVTVEQIDIDKIVDDVLKDL